ncbi:MAG: hypothetical protein J6B45_04975 [Clostridia bacterium]|nr:hypothetical protein [Clostridia bacterium]
MKDKIAEIKERSDKNGKVLFFVASYLNNCPTLVTKEIIEEITNGEKAGEERAFASFLANVFSESDSEVSWLEREYLFKGVKRLSTEEYLKNEYFKNIKIPRIKEKNWEFGYQSYKPYEGFIYRDIQVDGYTEIPQIGYFDKEFSFPTVYENGQEWMAIKPNEIETMKEPIENAKGNVLVFGLGIGYFTYMVSQKQDVISVCVVERDESAISLFEKHILPQFPNKHKIRIVRADAFEYAKNEMANGMFDYGFVDLWHDVSDGVDLYVKMKKYEALCPNLHLDYWIERSIISSIRWSVFRGIYEKSKSGSISISEHEVEKYLTDSYLKSFVKFI